MHIFILDREQTLPRPIEEVFAFYADAANLQRLTPPWLRFEILTERPIEMKVGARIDYRLTVRSIPLRWQSEITEWRPPHRFVDVQRRGPYRLWEHTHEFVARGEHTVVRDRVRYAVPGGRLIHRLFIARDVTRIFDFRAAQLAAIFGVASPAPPGAMPE